jgi:hypothetical protein
MPCCAARYYEDRAHNAFLPMSERILGTQGKKMGNGGAFRMRVFAIAFPAAIIIALTGAHFALDNRRPALRR